jgi:hypothetical protein
MMIGGGSRTTGDSLGGADGELARVGGAAGELARVGGADGELARVGGADGDFARSGAGIGGGAETGLERAGTGGGTEIGLDREASEGSGSLRSGSGVPSTIARSSATRSLDPGGGGGWVFGFLRCGGATSGVGDAIDDGRTSSTDQPDAKSAIRSLVSSPIRRRLRSSSGTSGR